MGVDTVPQPGAPIEAPQAAESAELAAEGPVDGEATLPLIMPEEVTPERSEAEEPEPVVTETMARLYAKQGHYREAQAIYEELLAKNPEDARLQAGLDEVKQHAQAAPAAAPSQKQARYSVAVTGGKSIRTFFAELAGTAAAPADVPAQSPPTPPAQASSAPSPEAGSAQPPSSSKSGFSFDEFFGAKGGAAPAVQPPQPGPKAEREEGDDDDFRDWLQRLKT